MTRPVAVRTPRGRLHIALRTGRGYRAACSRTVSGPDLVVHVGRDAIRARRLELTCQRCDRLAARGDAALWRAAGW